MAVNDLKHALVHTACKTDHGQTYPYVLQELDITEYTQNAADVEKNINPIDKLHREEPSPCREGMQNMWNNDSISNNW